MGGLWKWNNGNLGFWKWHNGSTGYLGLWQWHNGNMGDLGLWKWHNGNLEFWKWNMGNLGLWQWNRMKTCEFCLKNLIFPCTSRNFVSITTFSYLLFINVWNLK